MVPGYGLNNIILELLSIGGKLGVVLYVMITGYYMHNSNHNIKKLIKLDLQVLMYTVPIVLLMFIYQNNSFLINYKDVIKNFLPIIFQSYWFVTMYVLLYIFIPYINKLIKLLNKNEFKQLILLGIIILSLIPTLLNMSFIAGEFPKFILFYLIGSYISLYNINIKYKEIKFIIIYGLIIFLNLFTLKNLRIDPLYFSSTTSILIMLEAIYLFVYFKELKIKNNKYINLIAGTTFGIYLFHDNFFIRKILWIDIFKNYRFYNSKVLFIHAGGAIMIVFIASIIIELLRQKLEKRLWPIVENGIKKLSNIIKKNKIYNKIVIVYNKI